ICSIQTVKESDKEIDQLKTENTRQSQIIEDLQQNLNELNGKFNNRQNIIEQLNNEIIRLKQKVEQSEIRLQQFQSINDTSVVNKFEQHIEELQRTVSLKTNETEANSTLPVLKQEEIIPYFDRAFHLSRSNYKNITV
ncbi:unnamed protein product, partial [Rotaria magnacalcarata]